MSAELYTKMWEALDSIHEYMNCRDIWDNAKDVDELERIHAMPSPK
jgi:hypothetical protein